MLYCLFEDDRYVDFQPLVHFRPMHDLLCGALPLARKWEGVLPGKRVRHAVREDLPADADEHVIPTGNDIAPGKGAWFINIRVLPDDRILPVLKRKHSSSCVYNDGDTIAAAFLLTSDALRLVFGFRRGIPDFTHLGDLPRENITTTKLDHFWDLVRHNSSEIVADRFRKGVSVRKADARKYRGVHFLNRNQISVGKKSTIKPGVVLDAENGPILIGDDVVVMPNAVIEGPAFIGDGSLIKIGAKIYGGTSIGGGCKVGGEVENSIIHPFSNKQHEGFLGHSCVGSWVNIGADTNTSDLKNTYGNIAVTSGGVRRETGMQFLGLTMGDHSKSGINVMFDTGTVVGSCCNVYGSGIPPKDIPSFSWGGAGGLVTYRLEKALETMRRVMERRGVRMSGKYSDAATALFGGTTVERERAGVTVDG